MLRVVIHTGTLAERKLENRLAVVDIAYKKKEALADYLVALTLARAGEMAPGQVSKHPRWSASLWDLVARALTRVLYFADQAPPSNKPDKRCAYATRMCAVIERLTLEDRGKELGTAQLLQPGPRGVYLAEFTEDILGPRRAEFAYGCKALNPIDLLLRAICWALYGGDVLGRKPALILPPTLKIDGVERFHVEALDEPARTGFRRYQADRNLKGDVDVMPPVSEYVNFLMQG